MQVTDPTSAELAHGSGVKSKKFGPAFRQEAVHVLKLGLIVLLAKRNPDLCEELVEGGLTQLLLFCLLDEAHPMRQAAVLSELHMLRMMSPKSRRMCEAVLVKQDYLRAVSLEQFLAGGTHDDLARARFRLRNLHAPTFEKLHQRLGGVQPRLGHTAAEVEIQQALVEQTIQKTLGIAQGSSAFLTEGPGEETTQEPQEKEEVARSGDIYNVRRVPVGSGGNAPMDDRAQARGYRLDCDSLEQNVAEEPPVLTALFSMLADPLDSNEGMAFMQELPRIDRVRLSEECRGPVDPSRQTTQNRSANKASHHPDMDHTRAMVFEPVRFGTLQKRVRALSPSASVSATSEGDLRSEASSVSLLCVQMTTDKGKLHLSRPHAITCQCQGCTWSRHSEDVTSEQLKLPHSVSKHETSLAETSFGPEISEEMPSHEFYSHSDGLHFESLMTAASNSLLDAVGSLSLLHDQSEDDLVDGAKAQPRILQKSALTSLVEVPRLHLGSRLPAPGEVSPSARRNKKVLCVQPAPYHRCVAFSGALEEELKGKKVAGGLDPKTQQLHQNIKSAGNFPRRWLRSSGPNHAPFHEEEPPRSVPPWSAREPYLSPLRAHQREPPAPNTHRGVFNGVDDMVSRHGRQRIPKPQKLKDFFPASAAHF